jgi:membrane protein required for colicin V production
MTLALAGHAICPSLGRHRQSRFAVELTSGPDQPMPITILDLVLLAVMLISGLLAMVRGFMREVLSIAAWGTAALVTLYAFGKLLPTAKTYFNNDTVASVVVVAGVFIGTLIVVSIITVRISDMILDSRIGALDRTLGFLFGLARGLLIVVVAFLFFSWLVPDKQRPDWVTGAKSRVVLQGTGDWLMSLLPDDPENTILKRFKKNKPDDDQTDTDSATPGAGGDGYSRPARDSLKKLIEKPAGR